jgi:hypothetical protein
MNSESPERSAELIHALANRVPELDGISGESNFDGSLPSASSVTSDANDKERQTSIGNS